MQSTNRCATSRTESCTRAACKIRHMSRPIERQFILFENFSFLNGAGFVVLQNATTIRFSKSSEASDDLRPKARMLG